jgi:prophage antirepressor-like protein
MSNIKLFQDKKIRSFWDSEKEEWYFSVVDVCGILAESENPRKYWSVLKTRLKAEGNETATNCSQLKMLAEDGKMRMTDVLDTKGILRLIQSIPSPKAEPFKVWLSNVGAERLDEIADPEKAILRGADYYRSKGYTDGWINQRLL